MNYKRIYDNIVERSKNRQLETYTEKHHIVPRCIGGDDSTDNLVNLTPEEHYVVHQLLVKIYPESYGLVKAANMMCASSRNQIRNNKQYGWLKKKLAEAMSASQTGKNNSQYGTKWIFNTKLKETKKISKSDVIPEGWSLGRVINWNNVENHIKCKHCGKEFKQQTKEIYCTEKCRKDHNSPFLGKEQEFLDYYANLHSMNKALKAMGYPGAISHYYKWAKKVLDTYKK